MMRMLDTDVLIDFQRRFPSAVAWYHSLTKTPTIPGLAIMELIQDAQNHRQVQEVLRLVRPMPIVWPTEADCDRALADYTSPHLSHRLGLIDALIAACAVGRAATLCTFNIKHYRMIAGLVTEQPYSR
jgi:predicted nucleic acid-binding protein